MNWTKTEDRQPPEGQLVLVADARRLPCVYTTAKRSGDYWCPRPGVHVPLDTYGHWAEMTAPGEEGHPKPARQEAPQGPGAERKGDK